MIICNSTGTQFRCQVVHPANKGAQILTHFSKVSNTELSAIQMSQFGFNGKFHPMPVKEQTQPHPVDTHCYAESMTSVQDPVWEHPCHKPLNTH